MQRKGLMTQDEIKKLAEDIVNSEHWWFNHDNPNYEFLVMMITEALQKVRDETIEDVITGLGYYSKSHDTTMSIDLVMYLESFKSKKVSTQICPDSWKVESGPNAQPQGKSKESEEK